MKHFTDGGGVTSLSSFTQILLLNGYMFYISLRDTHVSTVHFYYYRKKKKKKNKEQNT